MDEREAPETDRAACEVCKGSGDVAEIMGDGYVVGPCWSCNGLGIQQTRDELANAAPYDPSIFANHDAEVRAALAQHRRAS